LIPESPTGRARQNGLCYVRVEVIDRQGQLVPDAVNKIQLAINGPAKLIGFGNGGVTAKGSFQQNAAATYNGRAMAILKSDGQSGVVVVTAVGDGLQSASVSIRLS
jgi:beta-galactosidase